MFKIGRVLLNADFPSRIVPQISDQFMPFRSSILSTNPASWAFETLFDIGVIIHKESVYRIQPPSFVFVKIAAFYKKSNLRNISVILVF